jgi:hypothetical protein
LELGAKAPKPEALRKHLVEKAGFVDDQRLLDPLVNLLLGGWDGFEKMYPPS